MKCPKSCNGCKAFYQSLCEYTCELGYKLKITKESEYKGMDVVSVKPENGKCPKPLTLKEFTDAPKSYESEVKE